MSQSPLIYSNQCCNIEKDNIESSSHVNLCYMNDDILYSFDEESFHEMRTNKPWNTDPYFFNCVKITSMAALKMLQHSMSGGNIEVMGLLQGKILLDPPTFLIMDAFSLPVEGTETRVDAQAEGYEHSVQYISFMKSHGKLPFKDVEPFPILGWYHSHPNYGCWLSGIDVNNQRLHQSHEDPFLAIVIDPMRSKRDQRLHIGAFRVLPSNVPTNSRKYCPRLLQKLPNEKLDEYGAHKHE